MSRAVLRRYRVGLDTSPATPRLTFPMHDVIGRLVAIKYRLPKAGAQMLSPSGRGREWPLYPWPNRNDGAPLLLCGGELDALCALSSGLPACSITLGVDTWLEAWTPLIARRRLVIAFDVGELRQARRLRRKLVPLGVQARVLDLQRLGVTAPKGDVSDYLLGGGDPERLTGGFGERANQPVSPANGARRRDGRTASQARQARRHVIRRVYSAAAGFGPSGPGAGGRS